MNLDYQSYKAFNFHRTIRYKGIFDFHGLYVMMANWIKSRDFDFYEPKILDKPPYVIHKMEGRKKVDFYVMFLLLPEIWAYELKPIEIVKDGKMQHLQKGRLKIIINGGFITDYDGDFEMKANLKAMERFLNEKILYHENLLKYFDHLDYYLYEYMTDIKKFLKMETATNAY